MRKSTNESTSAVFAKLNPLAAKSQLMISRGAFGNENALLKLGNVVIRIEQRG